MPRLATKKKTTRTRRRATSTRRHRTPARRDIGHVDDLTHWSSSYSDRMVPLLIRWPRRLVERVDAEVKRRREDSKKTSWWYGSKKSRAAVIRELVEERLDQLKKPRKAKQR